MAPAPHDGFYTKRRPSPLILPPAKPQIAPPATSLLAPSSRPSRPSASQPPKKCPSHLDKKMPTTKSSAIVMVTSRLVSAMHDNECTAANAVNAVDQTAAPIVVPFTLPQQQPHAPSPPRKPHLDRPISLKNPSGPKVSNLVKTSSRPHSPPPPQFGANRPRFPDLTAHQPNLAAFLRFSVTDEGKFERINPNSCSAVKISMADMSFVPLGPTSDPAAPFQVGKTPSAGFFQKWFGSKPAIAANATIKPVMSVADEAESEEKPHWPIRLQSLGRSLTTLRNASLSALLGSH